MSAILRTVACIALAIATMTPPSTASARALFAYPLSGQSLDQENKDRLICHAWAVDQTGFVPSGVPQETKGSKGAGTGLVIGGLVGVVAGGGTGLAIGAVSGGLIGGIIGSGKQRELDAKYDAYLRAAQTCLESKGYTVSR